MDSAYTTPWTTVSCSSSCRFCKNASPWEFELFRVNPTYHSLLVMYSESPENVTYCIEEQRGLGTVTNTNWPGTCLLKCYVRNAKWSFFARLDNASQKQFWKTMKHLCKTKSTVPALSHNGITATSDACKANMLNEFFEQCFNTSVPPDRCHQD